MRYDCACLKLLNVKSTKQKYDNDTYKGTKTFFKNGYFITIFTICLFSLITFEKMILHIKSR